MAFEALSREDLESLLIAGVHDAEYYPVLREQQYEALTTQLGLWLDRKALGVPTWFASDGCTRAPNWAFTMGPCFRHDYDYWLGGLESEKKRLRREADRRFWAAIKANAWINPDGTKTNWLKRGFRLTMAFAYFRGVRRFGGSSFRVREVRLTSLEHSALEQLARIEGKHWDNWTGRSCVLPGMDQLQAD